MWREHPSSTGQARLTAVPGWGTEPCLADQITEDVLQLLYAAGQEIADTRAACPGDAHAPLAALRVREAITALREIAVLARRQETDAFASPVPRLPGDASTPAPSGGISGDHRGLRGPGESHAHRRAAM
ncbi:hypothetical protein [Patulibacter sp.]|uniref:hypothetical protein n=1 Tax=Patulibacter sp. TaxID=1912859 RepID=UPI0027196B8D|nr:hypothetical protein [Patulibacter sp.]MDO9409345.1 hypothetical protein [Patulibacter sp.]